MRVCVQHALDSLVSTRFQGVTTLVIAHRLSTIRNANVIVVMNDVGLPVPLLWAQLVYFD